MYQAFDPFFKFNKHAKIRDVCHCARYPGAGFVSMGDLIPRVGSELFNAQGKPFVLLVNIEDHRLYFLPFFIYFGGVLDPFCPGNI